MMHIYSEQCLSLDYQEYFIDLFEALENAEYLIFFTL